jgi:hypothetical protein
MIIQLPPACACGCGFPVRRSALPPHDWNQFITGHNRRLIQRKPRGKNYPERECEQCKCKFKPRRFDTRYCSRQCQIAVSIRRAYLKRHGKLPDKERPCGICGKQFPRVDRYDWKRKYCSDGCARIAVANARKAYHRRNPQARAEQRVYDNPAASNQCNRFFIRYPDILRACMVCGENRVVDLHHKTPRRGAPTRAKNTQRDHVWVLCPNHHAMIERGVATPTELGLV